MKHTEEQLKELVICSVVDKKNTGLSEHCRKHCIHGRLHEYQGKNECGSPEFCNLGLSGTPVKVNCRKLKKKEIKEYLQGTY